MLPCLLSLLFHWHQPSIPPPSHPFLTASAAPEFSNRFSHQRNNRSSAPAFLSAAAIAFGVAVST